jgi:hypothetical protein
VESLRWRCRNDASAEAPPGTVPGSSALVSDTGGVTAKKDSMFRIFQKAGVIFTLASLVVALVQARMPALDDTVSAWRVGRATSAAVRAQEDALAIDREVQVEPRLVPIARGAKAEALERRQAAARELAAASFAEARSKFAEAKALDRQAVEAVDAAANVLSTIDANGR